MQLKTALSQGIALLERGGVPSPRLTAEVLLMHAAHCDRAHLYAYGERELTEVEWIHYGRYLRERLDGKPTQYITGHQEFWGLDFVVNPSVLIPRPETELVVETAATLAREHFPDHAELNIADVGTGSGCIAVALAKELPSARVYALDQSVEALSMARKNASRLGVERQIVLAQSDLLEPCAGEPLPPLQMIVSNPPYVAERDRETLSPEVRDHEPQAALFAGEGGGDVYARLIPQAARALAPGGFLVLELGYDSEQHVSALLSSAEGEKQWENITWRRDLAGIVRVVSGCRKRMERAGPSSLRSSG
jgi:release factor glutamine methyltransferase